MRRLGAYEECSRCGYSQMKASAHNDRMFERFGSYVDYIDELRPLHVCATCRRVFCADCGVAEAGATFCERCLSRSSGPSRRTAREKRDAKPRA